MMSFHHRQVEKVLGCPCAYVGVVLQRILGTCVNGQTLDRPEVIVRFQHTKVTQKLENEQLDDVVQALLGTFPGCTQIFCHIVLASIEGSRTEGAEMML